MNLRGMWSGGVITEEASHLLMHIHHANRGAECNIIQNEV